MILPSEWLLSVVSGPGSLGTEVYFNRVGVIAWWYLNIITGTGFDAHCSCSGMQCEICILLKEVIDVGEFITVTTFVSEILSS